MPLSPLLRVSAMILLASALSAEPRYMIDYLLPRGGARGARVEVEFHGTALENPREVLFYGPGITASGFKPFAKAGDGFKVQFEIAPDCPLGEHVLRVRTATALSDAVTFWVSPFHTVYEFETKIGENDSKIWTTDDIIWRKPSSLAKAMPVPMNSTVEGQILPGPDIDVDDYRVEARQGQRISIEVEAVRLGTLHFGGENDLEVFLFDADGKQVGHNDDSALYVQDPVLSVVALRTGTYYVELRQQVFYPPRQAWYRMHVGTFSRPTAIFPAGGQAGSTIEARILGDPAGERVERIALPETAGNFNYFAGAEGEKPPSPNVLRVSPYANVIGGAAATTDAILPAALNGILEKQGEVHTYKFQAKKGQPWRVQVFARTLGTPVDPKIWIRAANGAKNLLDADDSRLIDLGQPSVRGSWHSKEQLDPVAVFRAPADGEYVLGIEDTTGAGGPDHVYRVEIEPVRDTVYTHITMNDGYQLPRLTGLIVPRGSRWTLDVQLAQGIGNSYKGEIELEAVGLPRGVTMIAPRFGKGVTRMPVQFVAAADAEPQAALVELLARPVDRAVKLETGSRQGFALINRPGELPWHLVFLDKYALAVTDPPPFDIELEAPEIPLAQSSDLVLKVKAVRHGGFKGPIEIEPDWLPPGVSKGATVTIPPEKDAATFQIQANDKAAPGVYQIAMNASTTGGDAYSGVGRIRVSSAFVPVKVTAPYLTIDLQRSSVERGKPGQIAATVRVNQPFEGKASLRLEQLPKGVRMVEPAPQITAVDKEVVFRIAADEDALAGLYRGITCEAAIVENGQTVKERSGSGVLRVDQARVAVGEK